MLYGMTESWTAVLLAALVLLPVAGCSHDPKRAVAPGEEATVAASRPGPGARIQVLEPYDTSRIPVLFIHGIGGTPRDFRAVIDALDRTRFQAWVFSYPPGARTRAIRWWMATSGRGTTPTCTSSARATGRATRRGTRR
jgi:hypothetical protein